MPAALPQITTTKVIHSLASGNNQTATAANLRIDRTTVNRIAQAQKAEIEQLTLDYIQDSIPLIRDNNLKTLTIANNLLNSITDNTPNTQLAQSMQDMGIQGKDILTLADKKEYRAMLSMGIIPSNTSSTVVNQLITGDTIQLNTQLQSLISAHTEIDDDVIEVDEDEL